MQHKQQAGNGMHKWVAIVAYGASVFFAIVPLSNGIFTSMVCAQEASRSASSQQLRAVPDISVRMPRGFSKSSIFLGNDSVGTLISMDTSDGARAGFYSRKLHPNEMGFDFARAKYESAGKKVAIVVAAAFTSDWKSINGHAVEDGADVGSSWDINDGTVAIVGGLPEIIRGRESLAGKRKSSQEIMKQAGSMFQQFAAVSNSRPIHSRHFCIRTTPRFFVEFMRDGKSYFGVADFSRRMEINGAIDLLLKIGVKNAVYLDGGAVSQGYYY